MEVFQACHDIHTCTYIKFVALYNFWWWIVNIIMSLVIFVPLKTLKNTTNLWSTSELSKAEKTIGYHMYDII